MPQLPRLLHRISQVGTIPYLSTIGLTYLQLIRNPRTELIVIHPPPPATARASNLGFTDETRSYRRERQSSHDRNQMVRVSVMQRSSGRWHIGRRVGRGE